jgi:hypothetical protein
MWRQNQSVEATALLIMSVYAHNLRASKVLKPTYSVLILKGSFTELASIRILWYWQEHYRIRCGFGNYSPDFNIMLQMPIKTNTAPVRSSGQQPAQDRNVSLIDLLSPASQAFD